MSKKGRRTIMKKLYNLQAERLVFKEQRKGEKSVGDFNF